MSGLGSLGDTLSGGISSFFNKFVDFFEWMKEKFIDIKNVFTDFFDWLKDKYNIVKDWVSSALSNIIDWFQNFFSKLGDILSSILDIPSKFKELLKDLFIPTFNPVDEVREKINAKFSFITQMVELSADLFSDFDANTSPPSFSITLYGVTYDIIDFSLMQPYRALIHSVIIAVAWINFALWFFKFAPRLIKGGG